MISAVFNAIIYNPLYNGLVFLMSTLPWADVGVIIIIFTVLVKLLLFPLSQKSVKTQAQIREIEPEVKKLKERYKNDKEQLAQKTMALYKEKNIAPFSGFFLILIQIPIIFALYFIFLKSGLPEINIDILYSFVPVPSSVNVNFLGIIDVSSRNLVLALITGITQYIQIAFSVPKAKPRKENASFKDDLARSMQIQMRYIMPVVVFFIAYTISAAVSIYWTTSNLFLIGQEVFVRRRRKKQQQDAQVNT